MISPPSTHDSRMAELVDPELSRSPQITRNQIDPMVSQHTPLLSTAQLNPSWGYDLNLLSHAASHVALGGQTTPGGLHPLPETPQPPQLNEPPALPQYNDKMVPDGFGNAAALFDSADLADPLQDFTGFLDSVGLSSDWHSGIFTSMDTSDPINSPPQLRYDHLGPVPRSHPNGDLPGEPRTGTGPEETSSFSRFGSRLPSLQPESRDQDEISSAYAPEETPGSKARPASEISVSSHQHFLTKLDDFRSVLPKGFSPPSRHTLARFFAGYINGFHEHLPFIHVPTLSAATNAPELALALAAVGAQYRFENQRGIDLFYASKAVVMEQIRRRDSHWMPQIGWDRSNSIGQSPRPGLLEPANVNSPFQYMPHAGTPNSSATDVDPQMETIRALLLLTAFATWERNRELLREALTFQSVLARLVREHGLASPEVSRSPEEMTWEEWIRTEGEKRTKLIVYCFFNLHSITWNVPPLLLNAEIKLDLPDPADEWRAPSASQWRRLRRANSAAPMPFQETFAKLFSKSSTSNTPVTPLGNYVLIHAIIQQIFFARQLSASWSTTSGTSLRPEDLNVLENALSAWKAGWKRTPESSLDPQNPNGPVAFTSTAFLGLAYIRLHVDLGPVRHLESREPLQIARALKNSPRLQRSPRLTMALLHSAHALSIPIRLGIDFVARTQTFFWSIQHSLCSLECAFLLSKWLAVLPTSPSQLDPKISEHERKLLLWVRSMLDETDMAVSPEENGLKAEQDFLQDQHKIKQLSIAVVRVWAKTFKGNTSWAIVELIGSSLEIYADMLERDGL